MDWLEIGLELKLVCHSSFWGHLIYWLICMEAQAHSPGLVLRAQMCVERAYHFAERPRVGS